MKAIKKGIPFYLALLAIVLTSFKAPEASGGDKYYIYHWINGGNDVIVLHLNYQAAMIHLAHGDMCHPRNCPN